MKFITLNNGVKMPILGYGVYQIAPDITKRCVLDALEVGYRSIDTAQAYNNEKEVGEAIKESGLSKNEVFVTSKIWITNAGEERAYDSIQKSLEKLGHIDLMLIHQPFGDYYGSYRALIKALKNGLVRAIGVSNFYADRFVDLAMSFDEKPSVNQMETHAFYGQSGLRKYLSEFDTKLMSWASFAEGKNGFFTNQTLEKIAAKHSKSVAQIALRYLIQQDIIVIPKTINKARMVENFSVFDFELDGDDMSEISKLDTNKTLFLDHQNPETVKYLRNLI